MAITFLAIQTLSIHENCIMQQCLTRRGEVLLIRSYIDQTTNELRTICQMTLQPDEFSNLVDMAPALNMMFQPYVNPNAPPPYSSTENNDNEQNMELVAETRTEIFNSTPESSSSTVTSTNPTQVAIVVPTPRVSNNEHSHESTAEEDEVDDGDDDDDDTLSLTTSRTISDYELGDDDVFVD